MEEDRSALFNQLKNFSQRKLKKVETKVVTASGEQLVEKRGAKGLQVLASGLDGSKNQEAESARKLDLQVGLILPGFLIGSQDVAYHKSSLDSYGITHILNLDSDIENKFEDDYNYKNINIHDRPDFDLNKVMEDCFDYIDDGRHYGNVLVHCSGTIGLSRSTSICIAYLMSKENQKFDEAFNTVKEARSFVKPNEGFIRQLKEYEVKLRGAQKVKESGIDDPFALRKKQEIEQEKAMVAGASSVKNRMKLFGATLDTGAASRSKSVSPLPIKIAQPTSATIQSPTVSKWGAYNKDTSSSDNSSGIKSISKSMTPEPRKSWQSSSNTKELASKNDWRSSSNSGQSVTANGPPPPPQMPTSLHADDKSIKSLNSFSSNRSTLPPPPPPQPLAGDILKGSLITKATSNPSAKSSPFNDRKSNESQPDTLTSDKNKQRMVFGRVPPPPMKIKGGLSIEKTDEVSDKNIGFTKKNTRSPPINISYNAPNGSNAFGLESSQTSGSLHSFNQGCQSPLVLFNHVPPQFSNRTQSPQVELVEQQDSFKNMGHQPYGNVNNKNFGQLPKRTLSLGPRKPPPLKQPLGEALRRSPFFQEDGPLKSEKEQNRRSFNRMADELQSSLTELNNLIDAPVTPKIATNKPPKYASYITNHTETQTSYARQCNNDPPSPSSPEQLFTWKSDIDPLNWKASNSINDLRSIFESKLTLPQSSANNQRPPLSASPSILKNSSPWQTVTTPRPAPAPVPSSAYPGSNYTIRRTTSTSSRYNVRNPYRSQY